MFIKMLETNFIALHLQAFVGLGTCTVTLSTHVTGWGSHSFLSNRCREAALFQGGQFPAPQVLQSLPVLERATIL